jgi:hypothetical protein
MQVSLLVVYVMAPKLITAEQVIAVQYRLT